MAVIVEAKKTGKRYVLVGTGFGAYKATNPSVLFGRLLRYEEEGQAALVAICDQEGNIRWSHSDDLLVVDVDGHSPDELLGRGDHRSTEAGQRQHETPCGE